jgi:hypothetical protein
MELANRITNLPYYPPPPELLHPLPPLPSPPRKPLWSKSTGSAIPYDLSTHIIPAAYIRSSDTIELPKIPSDLPDSTTSKEERGRMVKEAERRLRELRAEEDMKDVYGKGTGYERVMWICLNRYYRRDSSPSLSPPGRKKDLTLFLAHANGFHKEV